MSRSIPTDEPLTFDENAEVLEARTQFLVNELIRPGQLIGLIHDDPKKATPVAICFDPKSIYCQNLIRCHLIGCPATIEVRPVNKYIDGKTVSNSDGAYTYQKTVNKVALGLYLGGACDMGGNLTGSFILDADQSWKTSEGLSNIGTKVLRDQWKQDRKSDKTWLQNEIAMLKTSQQEAMRIFPQLVFFQKANGKWHGHGNFDKPIDAWSVKQWVTAKLSPILKHIEVFPKTAAFGPPEKYSAGNHVRLPWGQSKYELVGEIKTMSQMKTSVIPIGPQHSKPVIEKSNTINNPSKNATNVSDFQLADELDHQQWETNFRQNVWNGKPLVERINRYEQYLLSEAYPKSIEGQNGHNQLLLATRERFSFCVSKKDAKNVLLKYNQTKCEPSWSDAEIDHKLDEARASKDFQIGCKLENTKPAIGLQKPTVPKIRSLTLNDLEKLSNEDVPWILSGYLARNAVTMIHGAPKVGKSTLVFAMLQSILSGEPFLQRATEKCGIVYLSEENPDTILEKTNTFGIKSSDRIRIISNRVSRGAKLQDAQQEIFIAAKQINAGLIIIDTVSAWAGWGDDQENKSARGEAFGAMAKLIASKTNAAVLLVHHSKKGASIDPIDAARGSSGLTGSCDIVCMLQKEQTNSNKRELVSVGRYAATPAKLCIELNDDQNEYSLATPFRLESRHQKLLEMLPISQPGLTRKQLDESIDLKRGKLKRDLDELLGVGLIINSGSGRRGDPYKYYHKPKPKGVVEMKPTNTATDDFDEAPIHPIQKVQIVSQTKTVKINLEDEDFNYLNDHGQSNYFDDPYEFPKPRAVTSGAKMEDNDW